MVEEKIKLDDEEMRELAPLVYEALARGDSHESVVTELTQNGMSDDDAEELVSVIEFQMYQVETVPAQHGGDDGGMGWLFWVGLIAGINILRQIFGW